MAEIQKKPILDKHQGRLSIRCPYCKFHRSEWKLTIDEIILSWNTYMREEIILPFPAIKSEVNICTA
jgi:hypothetical protein